VAIVAVMEAWRRGVYCEGESSSRDEPKVDTVVIDKTGTLTFGDPEVTDIVGLDGCSENQVLTYAYTAEKFYSPLAQR